MPRRRRYGTPPKPFDDAFPLIDKLETAVVARMVEAEFTVDRALYAMYDPEVVDKLKAAWPFTRDNDRTRMASEALIIPAAGATAITATVTVDVKSARMLVPEAGNLKMDRVLQYEPLVKAVQETHAQHIKFETLRRVVRWLNNYATPGAARHYCPWLTALLPLDHAFQKVDGLLYREPVEGIGKIFADMRECAAIMSAALLIGNLDHESDKSLFRVQIVGTRDNEGQYRSQYFGLL